MACGQCGGLLPEERDEPFALLSEYECECEKEERLRSSRRLVVREGRLLGRPFGLAVGWAFDCEDGSVHEVWWGNTRDDESLALLLADARAAYGQIEVEDRRHGLSEGS